MKHDVRVSSKPRKQRKAIYSAPLHKKTKMMSAHLNTDDKELSQYKRRSIPIHKGDTVKIVRGAFRGHTGTVAKVYRSKGLIEVDGVVLTKSDGKQVAKKIHPSNVIITKLDLSDPVRKAKLESKITKGGN
ncbi:MAG: 50S ribosomal protein L24 [Thermoplasmata archaeon]